MIGSILASIGPDSLPGLLSTSSEPMVINVAKTRTGVATGLLGILDRFCGIVLAEASHDTWGNGNVF